MLEEIGYGMSRPAAIIQNGDDNGATGYLDAAIASTDFEIDAGVAGSWPGSGQTVANLTAAPASGAAQTAYDWWLGNDGTVEATDPAFNAGHFSTDGGDYLSLKAIAGTIFADWHRSGMGGWWLAIAYRTPPAFGGVTYLMGNTDGGSGQYGVTLYTPSDDLRLITRNAGVTETVINGAQAAATDYLFIISADPGETANNIRSWQNSRAKSVTSLTFEADGGVAANIPRILASANNAGATGPAPDGTLFYAAAGGNAFIDDTEAGLIFDTWNARHGRTYA